ncbi:MAG: hypothetical protein WAM97_14830 [Acidimicrobiales bacterium]
MTDDLPKSRHIEVFRGGVEPGDRSPVARVRSVNFYADPGQVAQIARRIDDDVLPRLSGVEGFLGLVALTTEGIRVEIVAMSFWSGRLDSSEAISVEFRDEIERVTGCAPATKEFEVFKMVMPGMNKPSA